MKILITGAAGFIGSNFVHYMVDNRSTDALICVDALTYAGNIISIAGPLKKENISFVKADITDRDAMDALFSRERPDVVVNFAAESHVDRSITQPDLFLKTNILGTCVLMDMGRKYGTQRFHQVSTDEVYGDLPLDAPELQFTEETPIKASSPYSASKASADLVALAYYRTFGFPVTISRCSNNYGPYQFPEKLIPLMISNALQDKPLPVYGKGENVRDWLYVADHCSAINAILCHGNVGEIYNIGGNTEKTNLNVVQTIIKTLGKSQDLINFVADRPGHDLRYAINSSKIQSQLGWAPKMSFDEGIQRTIDWYLQNENWWRGILSQEYLGFYDAMFPKEHTRQ